MDENTQDVIPVCTLKGKLKKLYNKLIEVEFTHGLIPGDDPDGYQLSGNIMNAITSIRYRIQRERSVADLLPSVKNSRTLVSLVKMFKELSDEDATLLRKELENYLKPSLPSYDQANAYMRRNIIDLEDYRVWYTYNGNRYKSYSDHNAMYQNCSNSLHSDREDAKRVFNAAVDKLCEGLSGKELYDMLRKITHTDVNIKQGKYLGSRNSDVVSSSFHTYYDYEYEAVFKFQTVNFVHTHSSYYSGGW